MTGGWPAALWPPPLPPWPRWRSPGTPANLAIQTRAAVAAAQRDTDLTVQAVTAATATAEAANRQVVLATAQANETSRLVQLEQERRGEEPDDRRWKHPDARASLGRRAQDASLSVW